ncbi:glycosyltransferase family A protein, partial [Escherichia coli]|nr:glycosyltransferase family 2 protein [Escherichia coli]
LDLCSATLWSLINQNHKPDKIILWISKDAYLLDTGVLSLPQSVLKLMKIEKNLEIRYVTNIGPYRKIIPALREFSEEDILIYADDDVIYSPLWLHELMITFDKYMGEYPVASRVRKINKNFFGAVKGYIRFPLIEYESIIEDNFIITGVGGCVLKKKHIKHEMIYDDSFIDVAPRTDDLWLSKILQLSNTKIVVCPAALPHLNEISHDSYALNTLNNNEHKNSNVIMKGIRKFKSLFLAELGFATCNNDIMLRSIDDHFHGIK